MEPETAIFKHIHKILPKIHEQEQLKRTENSGKYTGNSNAEKKGTGREMEQRVQKHLANSS